MKQLIQNKGLEEYDGVKAAYEELEKITERAADLKAYIEGHQAGAEWLRLENEAKFDAVQGKAGALLSERSKRFRRSLNILDSIETRIGKVGELYRLHEEGTSIPVISNACMAIAYQIVGRKDINQKIIDAIENTMEREGVFYKQKQSHHIEADANANAMMAAAFSARGDKDKAGKILQEIETAIGRNGELYYDSKSDRRLYAQTNAHIALAFVLQGNEDNAERILEGIESRIGIHNCGLYLYEAGSNGLLSSGGSIIISATHFLLGNETKAKEIFGRIEEYFKTCKRIDGELIRANFDEREVMYININASRAIAYALFDGAKLCGLPKDSK